MSAASLQRISPESCNALPGLLSRLARVPNRAAFDTASKWAADFDQKASIG
jgi:hypothetical protein